MAENEKIIPLKIDTGKSPQSVKEMRDRLKELKDILVSTEKGTKEWSAAMAEAADIQHDLKETTAELNSNAMDFGQVASNCTKAVAGMVGAVQSAQAVMTLMGVESEDTAKAIQKMQASMAIVQGLTAFEEGLKSINRLIPKLITNTKLQTVAQKALNAAMTPKVFIPIIAAVSALTLAFAKCSAAEKERQKAAEEHARQMTETELKSIKDYNTELEKNLSLQRKVKGILGETDTQILSSEIKAYQSIINDIKEQVRQSKEGLDLGTWMEKYGANYADANEAMEAFNNTLSDSATIKHAEERITEYTNKISDLNDELKVAKALEAARKQVADEAAREEIAWANTYALSIIKNMGNTITSEDTKWLSDTINVIRERLKEENPFDVLRQTLTETIDNLTEAYDNGLIKQEEWQELSIMAWKEYQKGLTEIQKDESAKRRTEMWDDVNTASQLAITFGNTISSMGDLYAEVNKKNGEVSKEVLERQKAMQIAGTVISTLGGIAQMTNSVWSSPDTGEFWAKLALQIAMTTEMLTNMGISIAQIKNTTLGSTSTATLSSNAVSSLNSPVQYTQDVQGSAINANIRDTRVYVLESDITNSQRRVSVQESENRY